jgi:hypothetical protein
LEEEDAAAAFLAAGFLAAGLVATDGFVVFFAVVCECTAGTSATAHNVATASIAARTLAPAK